MYRNEILEAEGVVPDYEDGIRITDAKTLQIARVSCPVSIQELS
jgi:acetylglutamate kinase